MDLEKAQNELEVHKKKFNTLEQKNNKDIAHMGKLKVTQTDFKAQHRILPPN